MARKVEDGTEHLQLVAGLHRLEAAKRLGLATIECMLLEYDGDLRVELAKIDENFIRNDPSPAEHALLTWRRKEITRALAAQEGTLSQDATASRQARRRAGQKTGPDAASVRDQADKTGESKDKIQRSIKRFKTLGTHILESIIGTSLDSGAQLDALTKLPKAVRDDLANSAAADVVVSARRVLREAEEEAQEEAEGGADEEADEEAEQRSPVRDLEQAYSEYCHWGIKYTDLLQSNGLIEKLREFDELFFNIVFPPEKEQTAEQVSKRGWKKLFSWG